MVSAAGIIFSNMHDKNIACLTQKRSIASVPFGGRYRLIDFTLSNMVNAGIYKVGIVTHYNYQSLLDHLGSGKDWDLDRRNGGLKILPPSIAPFENETTPSVFSSRLEALKNAYNFVSKSDEEYIVLSDCDMVCNIDLTDVLDYHIKNKADITVVTKNLYLGKDMSKNTTIVECDRNGRVTNLTNNCRNKEGSMRLCLNMFVLSREYLKSIILMSFERGYTSFTRDVILKSKDVKKIITYEYDGYFAPVNSIEGYFKSSMDLLSEDVRHILFGIKSRPVFTKVKNSPPAKYTKDALVKNSLVADGCVIEGEVENCIIFRGVRIGKGSVVKNSVIMQDSTIGKDVFLNCVIADKNVFIKDIRNLSGYVTHPFLLSKGTVI